VSAASSAVTIIAQRGGGAVASLQALPFAARFENSLLSYAAYVLKTFWPSGLAPFYPNPFDPAYGPDRGAGMWPSAIVSGLFLAAVTLLAWKLRRTHRYLLVGWLWYLGTLVPVIGMVQVGLQAMADRYMYVPIIGLLFASVWGLADVAERWNLGLGPRRAASAAVLALLGFVAFRQVGFWHDNFTIWPRALSVTTDNYYADDLMASALYAEHDPQTLRYFQDAARVAPWDAISHGYMAANLQDRGLLREAIPEYEIAVHHPPDDARESFAYANLGIIYDELGDSAKADIAFERARSKDPQAICKMIQPLSQKVEARPLAEGYLRLGLLLGQCGRTSEARLSFEHALRLDPGRTEVSVFLGRLTQEDRKD